MRVYPARDARRVAFASAGPSRQRGFNRAAHVELKVAFPPSDVAVPLVSRGLTAGPGGA